MVSRYKNNQTCNLHHCSSFRWKESLRKTRNRQNQIRNELLLNTNPISITLSGSRRLVAFNSMSLFQYLNLCYMFILLNWVFENFQFCFISTVVNPRSSLHSNFQSLFRLHKSGSRKFLSISVSGFRKFSITLRLNYWS